MIQFTVNGRAVSVDVEPEMPLLWVLRDELGLTGTKYGCGIALCGACTVHIDGAATRTCVLPVSAVAGKKITTIEGLSKDGSPSGAEGLGAAPGAPVRLLPERPDHGGRRADRDRQEAQRRGHRDDDEQHLPLRHLRSHPRGREARGRDEVRSPP